MPSQQSCNYVCSSMWERRLELPVEVLASNSRTLGVPANPSTVAAALMSITRSHVYEPDHHQDQTCQIGSFILEISSVPFSIWYFYTCVPECLVVVRDTRAPRVRFNRFTPV